MSSMFSQAYPPVSLPQEVNPDSGFSVQLAMDTFITNQEYDQTVFAAETWLLQAIYCEVFCDGTAGDRSIRLAVQNDGLTPFKFVTDGGGKGAANRGIRQLLAIGMSQGGNVTAGSNNTSQGGLPFVYLPPGTTITYQLLNQSANDKFTSPPLMYVTRYVYGSPASGGGAAEPIGPFLYVPGPTGEVV